MARNTISQAQRTQNNPLNLGTFSSTSIRYLKGSLGPKNQVVGRADTSQQSNGGFGGGTYNHWFLINLASPAWIIVRKGPPRPQYIQVSAYDLNKTPIQGNPIFDADSIQIDSNGEVYIPYLDTVMSAQSDLYNQYSTLRLDKGDERYFPLQEGAYLICVSSTRNEPLNYEIGLVIEFPSTEIFWQLEDGFSALQENATTVVNNQGNYKILLEPGNDAYYETIHDHSLNEWKTAWASSHQDTDKFPELFLPLINRP